MNPTVRLYMCGGEQPVSSIPLGIGYLLSNTPSELGDIQYTTNQLDLWRADVVGLSATALGTKEAIDLLTSIKKHNSSAKVIVGGQSTLWKGLQDYPFDHIVIGEGERAFREILDGCQDRVIVGKKAAHLDDIKPPLRGTCAAQVPILSSRGCDWNCSFCSAHKYWGGTRFHSAERFIMEAINAGEQYPRATHLTIMDDLFLANTRRLEDIYKLWMLYGLHRRFKVWSFARSTQLTAPIAKMLKTMGWERVRLGIESGSDNVLKALRKGARVMDHQRAIDICNEMDLPVSGSLMHGVPGETEEDRELTKRFLARNSKFSVEGSYRFVPFPGTDLWGGESPLEVDMTVR